MRLNSVNTADSILTLLKTITGVAAFDAAPVLNRDAGCPFDFVPDKPGVLCWFNEDGSLHSIDVVSASMRKRLAELYTGTAGAGRRAFSLFAYEATSNPKQLKKVILEDHVRAYRRFPVALSA